jgi:hypothetical protein
MNCLRSPVYWIVVAVAIFVSVLTLRAEDTSPSAIPQQIRRPVRVTISKETTCLTGPIRSDGWLDYATAINERCSRGVTAENNAAIPFWRSVGPKDIPKEKRERFFKMLGISPLPDQGQYLVQLYEHLQYVKDGPASGTPERNQWEGDITLDQPRLAQSRPWSRKEFPVLANWLDSNAKPLEVLCAAADRTRFFEPLVVKANGSLLDAFEIMDLSGFRCAVELLRLRAMQEVAEGKVDAAWRYLLVCHRLARLMGQKALLVDGIVARGLERSAYDGEVAIIHHAHPTSEKLTQFRRELLELPGLPPMESYFLGERLFSLDFVWSVAAGDPAALRLCGGFSLKDRNKESRTQLLADRRVDWDIVFRKYNAGLDEVEKAWRQPTLFQRYQALGKLDAAARVAANRVIDPAELAKFLSPQTSKADISRQLADILFGSDGVAGFEVYAVAEALNAVRTQLTDFAFALAEYHNDRAAYPGSLAELSPKYIADIPKDPFSDQAYCYRPQGNGYLLYSVGRNGKDDGGANSLDDLKKYAGATDFDKLPDDIAIRTP